MRIFLFNLLVILFPLTLASQGFQWASMNGNPDVTDTHTVLETFNDQIYIASDFLDTAYFDDQELISAGGTDIYLASYSQQSEMAWVIGFGGSGNDYVKSMKIDGSGNFYLAGFFYDTLIIEDEQLISKGSQDVFLSKFDNGGNLLWLVSAGGILADQLSGMDLTDNGAVITGHFYGDFYIDQQQLSSTGSSDLFVASYNSDGSFNWVEQFGGPSSDQASSLASDQFGNVYVSGSFYGEIQIGEDLIQTDDPVGVFFMSMNADADYRWTRQLTGSLLEIHSWLSCDTEGNLYMAGNFSEEIDFGSKTFDAGSFNQDVYVTKYDDLGNLIWARHGHSISHNEIRGIDVDVDGNLYVVGHYMFDVFFDDVELIYTLCCGSSETFVMSYSNTGEALWGKQVSGARAKVQDVEMIDENSLAIAGIFSEDLYFDAIRLSWFDGFKNYLSSIDTDVVTSVGNNEVAEQILVYPNPASNYLSISSGSNQSLIRLLDASGQLIEERDFPASGIISIQDYPPGIYVFQAIATDGSVSSSKFVKN